MGGGDWLPHGDYVPLFLFIIRVFAERREYSRSLSVFQIDKATPRVIGGRPLKQEAEGKPRVQCRNEIVAREKEKFPLHLSHI